MYKLDKFVRNRLYWNLLNLMKDDLVLDTLIIRGPITFKLDFFYKMKCKFSKIIGLSSFMTFPHFSGYYDNLQDKCIDFLRDYDDKIIAWCHCFKEPYQYIPDSIPLIFISESDMQDNFDYLNQLSDTIEKKYDFLLNMPQGKWNDHARNLIIAQKWLNYMADIMNLKIIVIGINRKIDFSKNIIVIEEFFQQQEFWNIMASSRALFVASEFDASPRIIVEAISQNIPVLVNKNIIGGWKYINDMTGMFFDPDGDISHTINKFKNNQYQPLTYARDNLNLDKNIAFFSNQLEIIYNRNFESLFDGIIFINLNNRPDRLLSIQKQLKKMDIKNATRIEGIYESNNGHLGCAKSHVKALELAKQNGWNRFIILEDDFEFIHFKERFLYMFETFINNISHWDVLLLSYQYEEWDLNFISPFQYINRIKHATTTTGYIVNNYTNNLLKNFKEAITNLEDLVSDTKIFETRFAIDQHWASLQSIDFFFATTPPMGRPNGSKSSIMNL